VRPPAARSTPPTAGPDVIASWRNTVVVAITLARASPRANSRGNTPPAGRRRADAVPASSPTTTSAHTGTMPGPEEWATTARNPMTATIAASQQIMTLRMPHRSAITPPARMSTASGTASAVSTTLAVAAPCWAATQATAKNVTPSPRLDPVAAASHHRKPDRRAGAVLTPRAGA